MGTDMSSREEADWLVDNLHTILFYFNLCHRGLHLVIISCLCFPLKVLKAICFNRKEIIPTFFSAQ